ncbi:MAG: hypothetical protein QOH26_562 [Actinomycetota bacterium]|jgi:hypothetical protein|nr:hypothetical protein [Actinomycetota bacterium]
MALSSASAIASETSDPKDTASRLDIRYVRVTGTRNGEGRIRIETYGDWNARYLRAAKDTSMGVRFDDGDDQDVQHGEYPGGGTWSGGTYEAFGVFRYRDGNLRFVVSLFAINNDVHDVYVARRPNRHTVVVRFSFDRPYFKEEHLSVGARVFDRVDCPYAQCSDHAPDGRTRMRVY